MDREQPEILCIDDDAQGLKVRGILLEGMGFRVFTEQDGERGLRAFAANRIDAVVIDYEMPGMNGGEVALAMKRLRPEVPVLMLSALPRLPLGAPSEAIDRFIQKGRSVRELAREIERAISGDFSAAAESAEPAEASMYVEPARHMTSFF